jgi:hypothetical protein
MPSLPADILRARRRRITIIVVIALLVEGALALAGHFGPALVHLIRPVYFIVAAVMAVTIWHAFRRHRYGDRRHADRRSAPRGESRT